MVPLSQLLNSLAASLQNKASLDENSNPMITGGAPSLLTSAAGTDRSSSTFLMSTHTTSRRNGISGTHKQVTKFEQLKTKKEKKKVKKERVFGQGGLSGRQMPRLCGGFVVGLRWWLGLIRDVGFNWAILVDEDYTICFYKFDVVRVMPQVSDLYQKA